MSLGYCGIKDNWVLSVRCEKNLQGCISVVTKKNPVGWFTCLLSKDNLSWGSTMRSKLGFILCCYVQVQTERQGRLSSEGANKSEMPFR